MPGCGVSWLELTLPAILALGCMQAADAEAKQWAAAARLVRLEQHRAALVAAGLSEELVRGWALAELVDDKGLAVALEQALELLRGLQAFAG